METTDATKGARCKALTLIKEANDIFFQILNQTDEITFGDLIVTDDSRHVSLTSELVKAKVLARNEDMFWKSKYNLIVNVLC